MTVQEAFNLANVHHRSGRLAEAVSLYRQIIAQAPNHWESWQMLGVALFQMNQPQEAIKFIERAIALNPAAASCYNNLGMVLASQGRREEAVAAWRHATSLRPDLAEAWQNLGAVFSEMGRRAEAIQVTRRAIELRPIDPELLDRLGSLLLEEDRSAEAVSLFERALSIQSDRVQSLNNLGRALARQSDQRAAIQAFGRAIKLRPQLPELHNNLGMSLLADGQLDAAIDALRSALNLRTDYSQAHFNLGNALRAKEMPAEAIASYRRALAAQPESGETWNALGNALIANSELDEAIACYHKAINLGLHSFEVYSNLATAVRAGGDIDNAIRYLRRAVEIKPCSTAHHNLLYSLHFHPDYDARRIYEEHQRWNQKCAEPLSAFIMPHENDRTPDRRLRIGYVSPDFRRHPVGGFMLPLLSNHDQEQVEVYCYSDVLRPDPMTAELRQRASVWRNVRGLGDEQLAQAIRADKIDILVDLVMHATDSRLLVFARKPAPVQVTYLAYCGTTGLRTMDHRLTDPHLDPPGSDETVYSEESVRLPTTYWCYAPRPEAPPVGSLPAAAPGHVTFGCLNNFAKISPPVIALWQQLLANLAASKLILHSHEGSHRRRVRDQFEAGGVDPQRLLFVDRLPLNQYFELYHKIDIALDPFPYGGGTTTLDALWMGVPTVTLAGQTAHSRGGLSILSNAGLAELVAYSPEQYVQIAAKLAGDLPRLAELRATLRPRMRSSPLMDNAQFARDVEAAYRQMWHKFVTSG